MSRTPTIWIDLENTPHVPFFIPILQGLESVGCTVILTARDFAQTRELAQQAGLDPNFIGSEAGSSALLKAGGIASRAAGLAWYLKGQRIDLAVGHGSRGLLLAAKLLGIRTLTLYDYEGASVRLFNRLSTFVLTPEAIPFATLEALGLSQQKHLTYPGLKEEVYACDFKPDPSILTGLALDPSRLILTIRPPSGTAHYRSDLSFELFTGIMTLLTSMKEIQIVLMPRNRDQRSQLETLYGTKRSVAIPRHSVSGLNLLYHSDLVIGGGGTMNREAAALGVPVITIFKGPEGAVDRWLIDQRKMISIDRPEEIIPYLRHRDTGNLNTILSNSTRTAILEAILRLAGSPEANGAVISRS